ncbi:MAG: nuclear transport factor 2 family protein [Chitinophagales bacterium]|nr:nuclear transport factor 2 family protein [Chitinophagales bacterium]
MSIEELVKRWFNKWENGDFHDLPITESFKHTSPFGVIEGRKQYVALVDQLSENF